MNYRISYFHSLPNDLNSFAVDGVISSLFLLTDQSSDTGLFPFKGNADLVMEAFLQHPLKCKNFQM